MYVYTALNLKWPTVRLLKISKSASKLTVLFGIVDDDEPPNGLTNDASDI